MVIQQISIFLENKSGRLADVTRVIADADINLRAISIADTADFGILRVVVDKPEKALESLAKAGFTTRTTDVLGLEIQDVPGALSKVMEIFKQTGVNIEYLYASLQKNGDKAVVIFKIEDIEHGLKIVKDHKLSIVDHF
jgi:hypothetical protein